MMGELSKRYFNEYRRVLPADTKLRLELFVRVPQRGSPGVKDAPTDATCELETIT